MEKTLFDRALDACTRYCERHGYEILETRWSPEGAAEALDLVVLDGSTLVFAGVTVSTEGSFAEPRLTRPEMESLAALWLALNAPADELIVRFDRLDIVCTDSTHGLLRHHRSCFGEAS